MNGVAFESSGRSLVRKDRESQFGASHLQSHPSITSTVMLVPKPPSSGPSKPRSKPPQQPPQSFIRKSGHLIPSARVYKPKSSRGRRGHNMTLDNTRTSYQSVLSPDQGVHDFCCLINRFGRARRAASKRVKYSDKPCPRFTITGAQRGCKKIRSCHLLKAFLSFLRRYVFTSFSFCLPCRLLQPWPHMSLST